MYIKFIYFLYPVCIISEYESIHGCHKRVVRDLLNRVTIVFVWCFCLIYSLHVIYSLDCQQLLILVAIHSRIKLICTPSTILLIIGVFDIIRWSRSGVNLIKIVEKVQESLILEWNYSLLFVRKLTDLEHGVSPHLFTSIHLIDVISRPWIPATVETS